MTYEDSTVFYYLEDDICIMVVLTSLLSQGEESRFFVEKLTISSVG